MPEALVKTELKRLRDANTVYELVVSDGLYDARHHLHPTSTDALSPDQEQPSPQTASTLTPSIDRNRNTIKSFEERKEEPFSQLPSSDPRSEDAQAVNFQSPNPSRRVLFNPQDTTPPGRALPDFQTPVQRSPEVFPGFLTPDNNEDKLVSEDRKLMLESSGTEVVRGSKSKVSELDIQRRASKSLERLRNQRVIMERLKAEVSKKDIRLQSLTESVSRLEKELIATRATVQNQESLKGDLAAAKEKIDLLESTVKSKDHEMGSNLKKSKAMEELLRTSIRQEKEKREKDKSEHSQVVSELKTRLTKERQDGFNLRVQNQELNAEVNNLQANLVKEKSHVKKMQLAHEERVATLQREIGNLQAKEKEANERLKKTQLVVEEQKEVIRNTQSALTTAREEQGYLQKSVKDLENTVRSVRSKLIQTERKNTIEMENVRRKLQNTMDELNEKTAVCEKQKAEVFGLQRRLDGETKAKNDVTNMLIQRELELSNANSLLERNNEQLAHAEEQLKASNDKVDQLHKRMLVEMAKASKLKQELEMNRAEYQDWARSRMHLLEKFCEEEERFSA